MAEPRTLEERVSRLEGITEQINERLGHIERDLAGIREDFGRELGQVHARTDSLREEVGRQIRELRHEIREIRGLMWRGFLWMVGLWVTVMLAILTTWFSTFQMVAKLLGRP